VDDTTTSSKESSDGEKGSGASSADTTPQVPAEELLQPVISSWNEGIARTRNEAKWLLSLLGVAATFLFGTGLIAKPPGLTWADHAGQLWWALALAALGLGALGVVVLQVARVFRPVVADLKKPDDDTARALAGRELDFFGPSAFPGVAPHLQARYANSLVRGIEQQVAEAQPAHRAVLERQLAWARVAQAEIAEGTRNALDMDRYNRVKAQRSLHAVMSTIAGAFALFCGVAFQLALASPPSEEATAEPSTDAGGLAPGTVVTLVRPTTGPDRTRWTALHLDRCRPVRDEATNHALAVVVGPGKDSGSYLVQTVPEAAQRRHCERLQFEIAAAYVTGHTATRVPSAAPTG
jgi:hypothetical protein